MESVSLWSVERGSSEVIRRDQTCSEITKGVSPHLCETFQFCESLTSPSLASILPPSKYMYCIKVVLTKYLLRGWQFATGEMTGANSRADIHGR